MAGLMTRDQIIHDGLNWGGNPGLANALTGQSGATVSLAVRMLNMVLQHIHRAKPWPWLKKRTTVQADATDTDKIPASALPSNYRALINLRPQGVKFSGLGLTQEHDIDRLQALRSIASENGSPTQPSPEQFAIDEGTRTSTEERLDIWLYPKPSTRLTFDLSYLYLPSDLAAGTDKPIFPDHLILVNLITAWAKDYQRDMTTATALALANKAIAEYAAAAADKGRQTNLQLEFDEVYFPPYTSD